MTTGAAEWGRAAKPACSWEQEEHLTSRTGTTENRQLCSVVLHKDTEYKTSRKWRVFIGLHLVHITDVELKGNNYPECLRVNFKQKSD